MYDGKPDFEIDEKLLLTRMLSDTSWKGILGILSKEDDVRKRATQGFRLHPRQQTRIAGLLADACLSRGPDDTCLRTSFFAWYEEQPFHESMESYFHSDEYKEWQTEQSLKEGDFRFPETAFEQHCGELSGFQIMVLACFSPALFTPSQLAVAVDRFRSSPETDDLEPDSNDTPEQHGADNKTQEIVRELRKTNRELKKTNKSLADKVEAVTRAHAEQKSRFERTVADARETESEILVELTELRAAVEKAEQKAARYKRERKELRDKMDRATRRADNLLKQLNQLESETEDMRRSAYLDAALQSGALNEGLLRAINEPDKVKDILLSAIQLPKDDIDLQGTTSNGGTNPLWQNMLEQERATLESLLSVSVSAVLNGKAFDDWAGKRDMFSDLRYSLRARLVLLNLLQELMEAKRESNQSAEATP